MLEVLTIKYKNGLIYGFCTTVPPFLIVAVHFWYIFGTADLPNLRAKRVFFNLLYHVPHIFLIFIFYIYFIYLSEKNLTEFKNSWYSGTVDLLLVRKRGINVNVYRGYRRKVKKKALP